MFKFKGRNMMMTAMHNTYNQSSNCCRSAAACPSARISSLLDTAIILVVSIYVLCLRIIWQFA